MRLKRFPLSTLAMMLVALALSGCGGEPRKNEAKPQQTQPSNELLGAHQSDLQAGVQESPLFDPQGIERMLRYLETEEGFRQSLAINQLFMKVFYPVYDFEKSQPTPHTFGGLNNIIGKTLEHLSRYQRHEDAENGMMELVRDYETREGKLYQIVELLTQRLDEDGLYDTPIIGRGQKIADVLRTAIAQADEENIKKAIAAYYANFVHHFNRFYHKDAQWEIVNNVATFKSGGFVQEVLSLLLAQTPADIGPTIEALLARGDEDESALRYFGELLDIPRDAGTMGSRLPQNFMVDFLTTLISQYYPRR